MREHAGSPGSLLYLTDVAPYATVSGSDVSARIAGVHQSLTSSVLALEEMAELAGLSFVHRSRVSLVSIDDLERAEALALFTIGDTPWSRAQKEDVLKRVQSGDLGILGIHSATDSSHTWPEYQQLVGARFGDHPVTTELHLDVLAQDHPATSHLGQTWTIRDELYVFRGLRDDAQVLLQLSEGALGGLEGTLPGGTLPLSWCFSEGRGGCFYTSLGHFVAAFEDANYLRHLFGGLVWVRGERRGGLGNSSLRANRE